MDAGHPGKFTRMTTTASRVAGLLAPARDTDTPDAELVRRFAADRDDFAFVALVRRHGPMVFGVCRRVLRDWHLAEDAFQAAFLVLARRASAISPPGAVAGWLHGVAYRVAKDSRRSALRRLGRERPVGEPPDAAAPGCDSFDDRDVRAVIDDELRRLPAKYRDLLVACDLEGRPRQPVAEALGIPEGTLSSRLTAARRMLADRLSRRGVAPAVAAAVAAGGPVVDACEVPRALLASAARIGCDATGAVPEAVASLADGAIRAMQLRLLVPTTLLMLSTSLLGATVLLAQAPPAPRQDPPRPLVVRPAAQAPARPIVAGETRLLVLRNDGLVTIGPDGKNEKALTGGGRRYHPSGAVLSPDGTRYAVAVPGPLPPDDGTPGARRMPMSLHVRGPGEAEPGTDLGIDGQSFAWSPDGAEIAYTRVEDRPGEKLDARSGVVDVKTKKSTPLDLPADHVITDWSRDGKWLLTAKFTRDGNTVASRVCLVSRDAKTVKPLGPDDQLATMGKISPDGTRVLCTKVEIRPETPKEKQERESRGERTHLTRSLQVLDVATGVNLPVADVPLNADVQGYCWSPDGKKIAYTWRQLHEGKPEDVADRETESHLVVCDPDGKNQKTILTEKGNGQWAVTLGGVDWKPAATDKP